MRALRPRAPVSYCETEEPDLDQYVFCEKCEDYVYEYCSIHGPLLVIPDDKVPAKHNFPPCVPRAALTIPHVFLHLNYSSIPGAGIGVFTTLTLPQGVRFGPYRGVKTTSVTSDYCWQIYGPDRKPVHVVDAKDGARSNWMRFVNCSRTWSEQNLIAFQYQGELYYRTIKIIPRFTELLVFYGSEYANRLNIDLAKYNAPKCYAHKYGAPLPKKSNTKTLDKAKPATEDISPKNKITTVQQEDKQPPNKRLKEGVKKEKEASTNKKPRTETKVNPETVKHNEKKKRTAKEIAPKKELDKELKAEVNQNAENVPKDIAEINVRNTTNINAICHKLSDKVNVPSSNVNEINTEKPITDQNVSLSAKDVYLVCDVCNYQTVAKDTLERHMKFHDVNRKFSCKTCCYRFCTNYQLNEHILRHEKKSAQIYKCDICDFETVHRTSLKTHLLKHTGEKPYSCNICDYKCNRAGNLKTHLRTHSREKPYSCNVCHYKCIHAGHLKTHLRTHTGEKPYSCDICDHKFSHACVLKAHLRTHTGEKPYSCNVCHYKCIHAGHLKTHLRTHTGEKPYSCDICDHKFSHACVLKAHLRTHTGEKPYSCNVCHYKCNEAGHLKRHFRTHTGEKPYSCDICEYRCTTSTSLKTHLKSKHLQM